MTTTTTFSGMDPSGRNSSRVLRPPGGGSNFSLGFDEPKEQPVRRNKMASSIFGTPEENPPSWAKSSGTKPGEIREHCESSGPQRRNSTDANCGDFVDPKQFRCSGYCRCCLMEDAVYNKALLLTHILHGMGITSMPHVTGHQDFFSSICLNF
ncbi:jupiter microtubule associated homolog 1 isoform 2-T2 [Alca torda]